MRAEEEGVSITFAAARHVTHHPEKFRECQFKRASYLLKKYNLGVDFASGTQDFDNFDMTRGPIQIL